MSRTRSPAVAGQFYAGTESGLREQIESAFLHDIGPGSIPDVEDGETDLVTLVSPHAGYPFSGPVAAHGFRALAESGRPDLVVIVGPNHSGFGEPVAVTETDRWETPLGGVPIATGVRDALVDGSDVMADERTHAGEHSIEVQIPFIQYLYGNSLPVLPIAMTQQDQSTATMLAEALEGALGQFDGSAVVVASTDLTHYEPQTVAAENDRQVIDRVEALDVAGMYRTIEDVGVSMCGYGPTATGMYVADGVGVTSGTLFRYATSGDTGGSSSEVVGYASMGLSLH